MLATSVAEHAHESPAEYMQTTCSNHVHAAEGIRQTMTVALPAGYEETGAGSSPMLMRRCRSRDGMRGPGRSVPGEHELLCVGTVAPAADKHDPRAMLPHLRE